MRSRIMAVALFAVLLLLVSQSAQASTLGAGTGWQQFDWAAGAPAPTSPSPWEWDSSIGTFLTVTDCFIAGDRFDVSDWGTSLGLTSEPSGTDWSSDPDFTSTDPRWSSRVYTMAPGSHSVEILVVQNPYNYGSGYLRLDAAPGLPAFALVGAAPLLGGLLRRFRRK